MEHGVTDPGLLVNNNHTVATTASALGGSLALNIIRSRITQHPCRLTVPGVDSTTAHSAVFFISSTGKIPDLMARMPTTVL